MSGPVVSTLGYAIDHKRPNTYSTAKVKIWIGCLPTYGRTPSERSDSWSYRFHPTHKYKFNILTSISIPAVVALFGFEEWFRTDMSPSLQQKHQKNSTKLTSLHLRFVICIQTATTTYIQKCYRMYCII